jgi:hypothetical protein
VTSRRIDGIERDQGGSDHPCRRAQLGAHDAHPLANRLQSLALHHLARRPEQQLAGRREPPSDDDQLGVVGVHDAAEAGAELPPDLGQELDGGRVALVRDAHEPVGVGRRAERLAGELVGRLPRHVRLEVPVASA